jgi:hypothetical protein
VQSDIGSGYEGGFVRAFPDGTPISKADVAPSDESGAPKETIYSQYSNRRSSQSLTAWPTRMRAGVAWHPDVYQLSTFDMTYASPAKGAEFVEDRLYLINFALGHEHLFAGRFPVRVGLFTNNDAAKPVTTDSDETFRVDLNGVDFYAGMQRETTRFVAGVVYQRGVGQARVITLNDIRPLQRVTAESWVISLGIASKN